MWMIPIYLIFLILFMLGIRFAVVRFGQRIGTDVSALHRQAEHILETHRAPACWLYVPRKRCPAAGLSSTKQRERLLLQLDRLIHYFRKAPVFDEESTRKQMIEALLAVRHEWQENPFAEIVSGSDGEPEAAGESPED
jgi:DNA primase large subunit